MLIKTPIIIIKNKLRHEALGYCLPNACLSSEERINTFPPPANPQLQYIAIFGPDTLKTLNTSHALLSAELALWLRRFSEF